MTIEKLNPATPDITAQNVARIAELFPECVTEGPWGTASDAGGPVIDFDLLRQALSNNLVEGPQERYRLDWPGKREALLAANAPIDKTLRPMRDDSVSFDTTRNLFVEGDNLDALKLLQETYLGKVKMIYIDPPYNTGNDFIYRDDFSKTRDRYEVDTGQRDGGGGRLVTNPETNGRFHSDWLSMMYPRLKLARNLLSDDGAIFVSLDDGEISSLRKLCDEIFGSDSFVCTIIWQKVFSPKNTAAYFSEDHEYIVVYARDKNKWSPSLLPRSAESIARYQNQDKDSRGPWLSGALQARNYYSKGQYSVESPSGREFQNPKGTYWRFSKERFLELDADKRIWWGDKGDGVPRLKRFLSEVKDGVIPQTLWKFDLVGHTQEAKEEFNKFVDFDETENVLNSLKPSRLLKHAIRIGTAIASDDIVMDFFAGSGPMAHGLLALNAEDGGNRRFVAVQIAEPLPVAEKKVSSIGDLARSRIRTVGQNLAASSAHANWRRDVGFRGFRIDSGNLHDTRLAPAETTQSALSGMISHIKDDRSDEDLLFGALLRWGVDITLPIAKRDLLGRTLWFVDPPAEGETGAALIACFAKAFDGKGGIDTELADALGALAPLRVLFRDDGFASDAVKENVASRLKQRAPDTAVRVL